MKKNVFEAHVKHEYSQSELFHILAKKVLWKSSVIWNKPFDVTDIPLPADKDSETKGCPVPICDCVVWSMGSLRAWYSFDAGAAEVCPIERKQATPDAILDAFCYPPRAAVAAFYYRRVGPHDDPHEDADLPLACETFDANGLSAFLHGRERIPDGILVRISSPGIGEHYTTFMVQWAPRSLVVHRMQSVASGSSVVESLDQLCSGPWSPPHFVQNAHVTSHQRFILGNICDIIATHVRHALNSKATSLRSASSGITVAAMTAMTLVFSADSFGLLYPLSITTARPPIIAMTGAATTFDTHMCRHEENFHKPLPVPPSVVNYKRPAKPDKVLANERIPPLLAPQPRPKSSKPGSGSAGRFSALLAQKYGVAAGEIAFQPLSQSHDLEIVTIGGELLPDVEERLESTVRPRPRTSHRPMTSSSTGTGAAISGVASHPLAYRTNEDGFRVLPAAKWHSTTAAAAIRMFEEKEEKLKKRRSALARQYRRAKKTPDLHKAEESYAVSSVLPSVVAARIAAHTDPDAVSVKEESEFLDPDSGATALPDVAAIVVEREEAEKGADAEHDDVTNDVSNPIKIEPPEPPSSSSSSSIGDPEDHLLVDFEQVLHICKQVVSDTSVGMIPDYSLGAHAGHLSCVKALHRANIRLPLLKTWTSDLIYLINEHLSRRFRAGSEARRGLRTVSVHCISLDVAIPRDLSEGLPTTMTEIWKLIEQASGLECPMEEQRLQIPYNIVRSSAVVSVLESTVKAISSAVTVIEKECLTEVLKIIVAAHEKEDLPDESSTSFARESSELCLRAIAVLRLQIARSSPIAVALVSRPTDAAFADRRVNALCNSILEELREASGAVLTEERINRRITKSLSSARFVTEDNPSEHATQDMETATRSGRRSSSARRNSKSLATPSFASWQPAEGASQGPLMRPRSRSTVGDFFHFPIVPQSKQLVSTVEQG